MTSPPTTLTLGSRTSPLALWQTRHIIHLLQAAWPGLVCRVEPFVTQGDKTLDRPLPAIGGKGLFTAELEVALRRGTIDAAVHSLKDLPVADVPGLTLGAIPARATAQDGLVAPNNWTLAGLPAGAIIGSSSPRRQAQLLAARPDLQVRSIRGNVATRLQKALSGDYDGTVLAAAGLERLDLLDYVSEWLPLEVMLPAPGQGALAVQCRADDTAVLALLAAIEQADARAAVTAERSFLLALGGGCSAPIAAYAYRKPDSAMLFMMALVASTDGRQVVRVHGRGPDPRALADQLAAEARQQGAAELL